MNLLIKMIFCILVVGVSLYIYIDKQNELIELRLTIPALAKEVKQIQEKNNHLRYEINQFESPLHLMELATQPEFAHLKFKSNDEVLVLPKG